MSHNLCESILDTIYNNFVLIGNLSRENQMNIIVQALIRAHL